MAAVKDCSRITLKGSLGSSLDSSNGEIFVDHQGAMWDSSEVYVLHKGLDTVEQLYMGYCDSDVFQTVVDAYELGFNVQVKIGDFQWIVKSGKAGGYKYLLQNPHLGLNILYGSNFSDSNLSGHHLKIRCSPVFLLSRTIPEIQKELDLFARLFIRQIKPTGVAVHLACDVQGWIIPPDLDQRLKCKAKRVFRNSGIQTLEYAGNDIAMVYGSGQSYIFGSRSSLQFACYDKTKEVHQQDKSELWVPIWANAVDKDDVLVYDPDQQIARFELRFHHSVVAQFGWGMGKELLKLSDLEEHFNGLWQYGMNNFRLDDTRTYINPFWQFLRDDVRFYHEKLLDINYKRLYANPAAITRAISDQSLAITFGQLSRIYAKNGYPLSKAAAHLQNSGIWANLVQLYSKRGRHEDFILMDLEEKMSKVVLH